MTGTPNALAATLVATALAFPYAVFVIAQSDPELNLDDSFITLVYARNLAESGALIYNQGEPPVDGFTSLLDVAIKAAAIELSPLDPYRTSVLVNRAYAGLLLVALVLWVHPASRALGDRRWLVAALAPILFASSWDFAEGVATELETPLYAALGVLAIATFPRPDANSRRLLAWALCVTLLPLARPEGLVLAGLLLAAHAATGDRATQARGRWWVPAGVALALAAYYGWRIALFGHWAPNSYYAKLSDSRWREVRDGFAFVARYATHTPLDAAKLAALLLAPLLLWVSGWSDGASRRAFALAIACAWASLASVLFSGGDSYPDARRLLSLAMLIVLGLPFLLLSHADARVRRGALTGLALVAVVTIPSGLHKAYRALVASRSGESIVFRFPVDCVARVSRALVALAPDGRIAQSDFQLVKYFVGDHPVVDLHGLNDVRIAHEPWGDRVTFGKFSQANGIRTNAEIYVYGNRLWSERPMAAHPLREILEDARLHWQFVGYGRGPEWPEREQVTSEEIEALVAAYRPASLRACGAFFNFLIRRDVAERASASGVMIGPS